MTDMYNAGMYDADHVESVYNRSDPGTKVPVSVREQEWFRSLCGVQWAKDEEESEKYQNKRWQSIKDTNGVAPPKYELKPMPEGGYDKSQMSAIALSLVGVGSSSSGSESCSSDSNSDIES